MKNLLIIGLVLLIIVVGGMALGALRKALDRL